MKGENASHDYGPLEYFNQKRQKSKEEVVDRQPFAYFDCK